MKGLLRFKPYLLLMSTLTDVIPCGHAELGPLEADYLVGNNWSRFRLMFVTNRHAGKARRESGVELGFKSEHLLDLIGVEDPYDVVVNEKTGTKTYGLMLKYGKAIYKLTAEQRAAEQLTKDVHKMSLDEKRKAVDYVTNQQTLSPDLMPQPA